MPAPAPPELPPEPGTYALWLRVAKPCTVSVGRLGELEVTPDLAYVYVGSAFGPGGVAARLGRHLAGRGRRRWHVDHLRAVARPTEAWVAYDRERREHLWAAVLAAQPSARLPLPGFGASDCTCPAHLVAFAAPPGLDEVRRHLLRRDPAHGAVQAVPRRTPA